MAGELVIVDSEFLRQYDLFGKDRWQFEGLGTAVRLRLARQIGWHRHGNWSGWSDLQRRPIKCACGHVVEFCIAYELGNLQCAICHEFFWGQRTAAILHSIPSQRMRVVIIDAVALGIGELSVDVVRKITDSEESSRALMGIARIAGTDDNGAVLMATALDDLGK